MSASDLETFRLMERMFDAVAAIALGQPACMVAEAVTRVAAAIVAGASPGKEAEALSVAGEIFAQRADVARRQPFRPTKNVH